MEAGNYRLKTKEYDKALVEFGHAIELFPNDSAALTGLLKASQATLNKKK